MWQAVPASRPVRREELSALVLSGMDI